jgi:hypothetical protein
MKLLNVGYRLAIVAGCIYICHCSDWNLMAFGVCLFIATCAAWSTGKENK